MRISRHLRRLARIVRRNHPGTTITDTLSSRRTLVLPSRKADAVTLAFASRMENRVSERSSAKRVRHLCALIFHEYGCSPCPAEGQREISESVEQSLGFARIGNYAKLVLARFRCPMVRYGKYVASKTDRVSERASGLFKRVPTNDLQISPAPSSESLTDETRTTDFRNYRTNAVS